MSSLNQKQTDQKTANSHLASALTWLLVVGFSYVFLLATLAGPHIAGHRIKIGNVAPRDLIASRKIKVIDEDKTAAAKEIARHDVLPVLTRDKRKSIEILKNLDFQLERLRHLIAEGVLPLPAVPALKAEEQVNLIKMPEADFEKLSSALSSTAAGKTAASKTPELENLRALPVVAPPPEKAKKQKRGRGGRSGSHEKAEAEKSSQAAPLPTREQFLQKLAEARKNYQKLKLPRSNTEDKLLYLAALLKPDQIEPFIKETEDSVKQLLSKVSLQPYVDRSEWEAQVYQFLPAKMEPSIRDACAKFVADQLESNVSLNQEATEEKFKEAVRAVQPVMKEIELGSVIVKKGDTVRTDDMKALESVGLTKVGDTNLSTAIAVALFAAFLLLGTYLHMYEPKLFFSPSALALMATLSIITCLAADCISENFPEYVQFVPLSAMTLILAVTYGRRLTGILVALTVLFLSVAELVTGPHLVALAAAAGMALGTSVKRRNDMAVTGVLVGCLQAVGYVLAVMVTGSASPAATPTMSLWQELGLEFASGLLCSVLAMGSLPLLEHIFGILTPYRIAELSEPDQPLMRQLEENAPGTYQHSLAVANLAEGGARAIGANVNLVHTGAMYHDIGKMVTPRYFIENQLGDKNPHDFIPPEESRAKVFAHVTNGLALAQKYGLPKAVQAFIPEHQGTTVMAYFYHKACLRDGAENVDQRTYRYAGPKPQTKETAIVMLADVSEAVTHSLHDPSMEEVDAAISGVFKAFWNDGQFTESGLSKDELEKVRRGFVRVWRTLHHERLKYPSTTTGQMPVAPAQVAGSSTAAKPSGQNGDSEAAAAGTSAPRIFSEPDC